MVEQRLNDDILGIIASFLDAESLEAASETHPVFWEVWVRQQYAKVEILGTEKKTKDRLAYIRCVRSFSVYSMGLTYDDRQVPSLACQVKHVYVKPWLVPPCDQSYQSRRENALKHISALIDPHSAKKQAQYRLQKRFSKDIDWLYSAVSFFPNVDSYTLDWNGSADFHPELYDAFLIPILSRWKINLRQLTLCLPPQMYSKLSQFSMPSLQTLEIRLDTGSMDPLNVNIHLDALLVFIHNLKDSLRSLSIRSTPSSEGLDLSRLFRHIGTFPHLRAFSITIPFDGGHLSSIPPFVRFVQRHSATLESLALQTTRCSVGGKSVEHDGKNWIQAIVGSLLDQPLPQLESLTVALRPLRAPLDLFRDFLQLHGLTLKHLSLTDRSLTKGEIEHFILSPLNNSPLKQLELRCNSFTPRLLCSMATYLPDLDTLKLAISECNRNPVRLLPVTFLSLNLGYSTFLTLRHSFMMLCGTAHVASCNGCSGGWSFREDRMGRGCARLSRS